MNIIEYLRQFRVGEYAIFDFAVSFLGMALLAPLLSWLCAKINLRVPKRNWIFLTLPVSILAHVLVGKITPFTKNFLNPDGYYAIKLGVLGCCILAVTDISRITKKTTVKEGGPWENFAKRNAHWHISTKFGSNEAEFWQSGERTARFIWDELCAHAPKPATLLDIGAGVGRVCLPLSSLASEVIAVDISPTMLRELNAEAKRRNLDNIKSFLVDEPWENEPVDAAYCVLTFQHIEGPSEIATMLKRLAKTLRGVGYLQFDTRRRSIIDSIKMALPDWLLPPSWRRGMRRVRRPATDVRALLNETGFIIIRETQPDSSLHGFTVRVG